MARWPRAPRLIIDNDGLPHNEYDLAIVRTILALGSSLKMKVIAEGAESAEQRNMLAQLGVPATRCRSLVFCQISYGVTPNLM